jgi:hypothetical protein
MPFDIGNPCKELQNEPKLVYGMYHGKKLLTKERSKASLIILFDGIKMKDWLLVLCGSLLV